MKLFDWFMYVNYKTKKNLLNQELTTLRGLNDDSELSIDSSIGSNLFMEDLTRDFDFEDFLE